MGRHSLTTSSISSCEVDKSISYHAIAREGYLSRSRAHNVQVAVVLAGVPALCALHVRQLGGLFCGVVSRRTRQQLSQTVQLSFRIAKMSRAFGPGASQTPA